MTEYTNIFKPLKIRNTVFRNRILGAPILPFALLDEHCRPSEAAFDHYLSKVKGGTASIAISGYGFRPNDYDKRVPLYDLFDPINQRTAARLADMIHSYGAVASLEAPFFNSYGYTASGGQITGAGSSPHMKASRGEMPEEIMFKLADEYAEFAGIVKDLGFDMMMFHFAHGNIISQFLSPFWNKRTDQYGGSVANRARFPLMIIDRVRERVGKDFLLEMRITGDEKREGGITMDQTVEFLKMVEGKIDIAQISTGGFCIDLDELLYSSNVMPSDYMPDNPHVHYAKIAKEETRNIVIGAMGALQDVESIDKFLGEGCADVVYMARGLIAEPELVNKAYHAPETIRPCIKCYHCVDTQREMCCSVNPATGRERWAASIPPAKSRKRVAVVGGGPAGMNAALEAAKRGLDVTLYERENYLGGRIIFGDKMEFKRSVGKYKQYLINQIKEHGVKINLGVEVTKELLEKEAFDHVILAIGAKEPTLPIPGSREHTLFVGDIYEKDAAVTGDTVIIGGGFSGVETAVYLSRRGHKITLLEMAPELCGGLQFGTKTLEYYRVAVGTLRADANITALTSAKVQRIEPGKVWYTKDGIEYCVNADTIVMAAGLAPRTEEALEICPDGVDMILVGDCKRAKDIEYATRTGFEAAARIP